MLHLQDRHQRALNTFGKVTHSPTTKSSATATNTASHSSTTSVRSCGTPPLVQCDTTPSTLTPPLPGEPQGPQPSLAYLLLKIPDKAWYVTRVLWGMRLENKRENKRKDTITYREIAKILGFNVTRSKTNKAKHRIALVINKLISLGVLTRSEEKGIYTINYVAVEYYANVTLPMGTKLEYLPRGPNYEYWPEAIETAEVAREFNSLVTWTRVIAPFYSEGVGLEPPAGVAGNTGFTPPARKSKRTASAKPATLKPPRLRHLTYTVIVVGHHMLSVLKRGLVYFLLMGIRGAAQTAFPCIRCSTPSGGTRYLCAGSVKVLQELLASVGPNPICSVLGGDLAPTSLVADVPGHGLMLFDQAPADTPRLEPGLQVYGSALNPLATRYNLYIGYSRALGLPAVEVVARSVIYKELKRGNLRLLADLPLILDALGGAVHTALSRLPVVDSLSLRSLPGALLRGTPPPPGAGAVTVYVDYKLEVAGRKTRRNVAALCDFIALLRYYADRGKEVSILYLKVIVPLVGAEATGLADTLNFGYLYIYHNKRKDPPGAVRFEFRPYSGVKKAVGKYGLLNLFVRSLATLLPALEATHRALVPWAPLRPVSKFAE